MLCVLEQSVDIPTASWTVSHYYTQPTVMLSYSSVAVTYPSGTVWPQSGKLTSYIQVANQSTKLLTPSWTKLPQSWTPTSNVQVAY